MQFGFFFTEVAASWLDHTFDSHILPEAKSHRWFKATDK
jgi:hypothetical protein